METFNTLKKYFQTTHPDKLYTFLFFISDIASEIPYMLTPLVYGMIIKYMTELDFSMLIYMFILYFGLKIFSKIAVLVRYHFMKKYYHSIYRNLQNGLTDKLNNLSIDWFTAENKANILNVENVDLKKLCFLGSWLNQFSVYVISFIISTIILAKITFWLVIPGIAIDIIIILLLKKYNKKFEQSIRSANTQTDKETSLFSQLVNGIREIKVFNIMDKMKDKYRSINNSYLEQNDKVTNNSLIIENLVPTITMLSEMMIMAFLTFYVFQKGLGVDSVVIVITYFGNLFSNLCSIVTSLGELKVTKVSIDRYNNIINSENVYTCNNKNLEKTVNEGNVCFENVSFGYENTNVLHNFNINIQPNSITALVGKSGSGKSTVFNLLTRFYKPKNGKITLDGTDIFDFSQSAYSENVSVIRQDPFIFNMSIYENLALISPDMDKIISVCKRVHIHDYIMSLPDQYNTVLNEDATDLSGGQKQRLAIARTLLKGYSVR